MGFYCNLNDPRSLACFIVKKVFTILILFFAAPTFAAFITTYDPQICIGEFNDLGVQNTAIQAAAANGDGTVNNCNAACLSNNPCGNTSLGQSVCHQIGDTVYSGGDIYQTFELNCVAYDGSCEDLDNDNVCDGTAPEPPDPCDAIEGQQDFYSCTSSSYELASSCVEGAVTPQGCELETTVNPAAPDCVLTGTSVANGGTGNTYTCVVDLTGTGDPADPGDNLPQTDSEDPTDEETGDTTEETGEQDGCTTATTTQTTIFNRDDGTKEVCTTSTEQRSGVSCGNPGSTTDISCTIDYGDGSQTKTETSTERDENDNVESSNTNTSSGPSESDIPDEEDSSSYSEAPGCDAPPSCSGDVLQCAIVNEQWSARCDFVNSVDDFTPPDLDPNLTSTTVDVTQNLQGILATDGWIANDSCPDIPSIQVMGATLDFSFEGICTAFSALGFLVLAFAGFTSLRVFMGAF